MIRSAAAYVEKLAIETFSVVLGIVLAFAVNAWHERRARQLSACEALAAIRNELATTQAGVRARLPYHEEMRDSVAVLVARTRGPSMPNGLRAISNWSGVHPTPLFDDAWQTARSTQALQYLPYDAVVGLSRVYASQQRIVDASRGFSAAVYTPAFATGGVAAVAAMDSCLEDLTSNERHLLAQLDSEVARPRIYCR
jgi:hypothetical protein